MHWHEPRAEDDCHPDSLCATGDSGRVFGFHSDTFERDVARTTSSTFRRPFSTRRAASW